jgi:MFS family permease
LIKDHQQDLPLAENKHPAFFYGYIIVVACFLTMVVMYGLYYSFGIFFKPVLTEFGWTRAMTSGAFSLSMLLSGFLTIMMGKLNDNFGPRLVMAGCGLFLGVGYLLISQVGSIWQLYLFYGVFVAIGMSGSYVPLLSTVARWFVRRRGLMTGIVVAGIGAGTMLLPPLARWLIADYGWRISYIVIGIIALVFVMGLSLFLKRDPAQIGQVANGAEQVGEQGADLQLQGVSFSEAIRTRGFWALLLVEGCFGFILYTVMVHIAPHAIDLGNSAVIAANIIAIIGGLSMAGRVILGGISDRIGSKSTMIIGLILMSLSFFWLQTSQEVWMLYLFAVVFGFGYGGFSSIESPIVAELFGLKAHGTIFGCAFCSGVALGSIGPVLAGRLFDIAGNYTMAFWVTAAVSTTGLISAFFLRPAIKVE